MVATPILGAIILAIIGIQKQFDPPTILLVLLVGCQLAIILALIQILHYRAVPPEHMDSITEAFAHEKRVRDILKEELDEGRALARLQTTYLNEKLERATEQLKQTQDNLATTQSSLDQQSDHLSFITKLSEFSMNLAIEKAPPAVEHLRQAAYESILLIAARNSFDHDLVKAIFDDAFEDKPAPKDPAQKSIYLVAQCLADTIDITVALSISTCAVPAYLRQPISQPPNVLSIPDSEEFIRILGPLRPKPVPANYPAYTIPALPPEGAQGSPLS